MLLLQNVRFALRVLGKSPGFTAVAVLTLALGIGGNTALFSLVDQLLLRELPIRDPERLVSLSSSTPRFKDQPGFTIRDLEAFQQATPVLSELTALRIFQRIAVEWNGAPEEAYAEYVAGNYFSMLGVPPALGRLIGPADDSTSSQGSVVVISFGCWQRRFGADPAVIGKTIRIDARPVTVIGVSSPGFYGLSPGYSPEFRLPLSVRFAPVDERQRQTDSSFLLVGRLQPGVRPSQAEAYLRPVYAARDQESVQYMPESARSNFLGRQALLNVKAANHGLYGLNETFATALWIVFAMTAVVLLVACVNIAGLSLSQAERRHHETAIRLALGASRRQIIVQFLIESLLLSLFGTLLGSLFASWASRMIVSFVPSGGFGRLIPVEIGSGLTFRTLLFLAGMSVLASVLSGLTPAVRATRGGLAPMLKRDTTILALGRRRSVRNLLLAGQIGLSLFLVLGATALVGSLEKLLKQNPGYARNNVLMVSVDPLKSRYRKEQAHQFFDQLLPRVARLPGVQSASLARYNPLGPTFAVAAKTITSEGYTPGPDDNQPSSWPVRNVVSPRYFETLGIHLLNGRDFTEQDGPNSPKIAIVNERFAQHYFGTQNPLGRRIGWDGRADVEIVGVVENAKYSDLRAAAKPYWYIPYAQLGPSAWQQMTVQARVSADAAPVAATIRKEIAALDPDVPVFQITTIETEINYHLSRERLLAALGGFFGILAALLVAIGTYGVISDAVTRRTKEIGIRFALGADRGQIARMVISDVMSIVFVGIVAGLPLLWIWRTLLTAFVYGLTPTDPVIAILGISLVAGIALLATYGPVRRATSVDPMVTLRYE